MADFLFNLHDIKKINIIGGIQNESLNEAQTDIFRNVHDGLCSI